MEFLNTKLKHVKNIYFPFAASMGPGWTCLDQTCSDHEVRIILIVDLRSIVSGSVPF